MTLIRQIFILASATTFNIGCAAMMAFPTALLPSLLASNGTHITATIEEASWIVSSSGISGVPGLIILPIIMQRYGRKIANIMINLLLLIGWIIFLFANDTSAMLLARIIQGFAIGGTIISSIIIGEYIDPVRRGYFMVIKRIFFSVGALIVHILVLVWSWRQIAGFLILFNLFGILTTLIWPESPAFLAWKARFEDCKKSFIWLHGNKNRKELENMISVQQDRCKRQNITKIKMFKRISKTVFTKDCFIAFLITILLTVLIETSGRHYFAAYLVQMMRELVGSNSLAVYISIGNDCAAILGLTFAWPLVKLFKRRTLLFFCTLVSVLLLFLLSLALFLNTTYSLHMDWWIVFIIFFLTFISSLGIIPLSFTLFGEIFPLDLRGVGASISGVAYSSILAITLKTAPIFIKNIGMSATFLINGSFMLLSLVILFFILPETKDRTLQEIEYEMKGLSVSSAECKVMIPTKYDN